MITKEQLDRLDTMHDMLSFYYAEEKTALRAAISTLEPLVAGTHVIISAVDLQRLRFAAGFDDRAPDLDGVAGKPIPLSQSLGMIAAKDAMK